MTPQQRTLWDNYRANRSHVNRNAVMDSYMFVVLTTAAVMFKILPDGTGLERDDLISDGSLGLLQAVEQFDPSHRMQFHNYARLKVRSAILDGLRRRDWTPRMVRARRRLVETIADEFRCTHGRDITDDELRPLLPANSPTKTDNTITDARPVHMGSIDQPIFDKDTYADQLEDHSTPSTPVDDADAYDALLKGFNDPREVAVIEHAIMGDVRLTDVGASFGLSESRISQLKTRMRDRLFYRAVEAYALPWDVNCRTARQDTVKG